MMDTLDRNTVKELEKKALERKNDPYRLHYHLMPVSGRMNDPNGLIEIDGENHIFFQYTPQALMASYTLCWGHFVTKDFIHFKYLPPALLPEEEYERNGNYSGSAIKTDNGLTAYYTGNVKEKGDYNYITNGRKQVVVKADNYNEKDHLFHRKQVILDHSDYPDDLSLHVRDPKIYKKNGYYYLVLGARTLDSTGAILIYRSKDSTDFKLYKRIDGPKEMGYMWECPDVIWLDGKEFLIFSPQGIEADSNRTDFSDYFVSGYVMLEEGVDYLDLQNFVKLDNGFDYYAPQSYVDEDGRIVLIAWMGLPSSPYHSKTTAYGWIHNLTIPRYLERDGNRLLQKPLPELKTLREQKQEYQFDGKKQSFNVTKAFELYIKPESKKGKILIRDGCLLEFNKGTFILSFLENDQTKLAGAGRDKREVHLDSIDSIHVFVDACTIEVFLNDGEKSFSTKFFPDNNQTVEINKLKGKLSYWPLRPITITENGKDIFKFTDDSN